MTRAVTSLPTSSQLLRSLADHSLPLIQEFADDEHLAHIDEREQQLAVIRAALAEKEETAEHLVEFLAVAELDKFKVRTPPAEHFCTLKGLRRGTLEVVHGEIRQALYRDDFPVRDLVDYLDSLRENGRQHIFLYRLRKGNRSYLNGLRSPQHLQGLLAEADLECFTEAWEPPGDDEDELPKFADHAAARYLWEATRPRLAMVSLRKNRQLVFKWVETRDSGARAVNFFFLDLAKGFAEIRIQWIEGQRQRELARSVAVYRALVSNYIEIKRFDPLMLEPANRRILHSDKYDKIRYAIERPGEHVVRGRGGTAKDVSAVMAALEQYFCNHVDTQFQLGAGETLRAQLDGKTNELRVKWECAAQALEKVLARVRTLGGWAGVGVETIPPGDNGKPAGEGDTVEVGTLLRYLERFGRDRMSIAKLRAKAQSMFVPADTLITYLERGAPGSDELADARFYVRCPLTEKPAPDPDAEFARLADVPQVVDCQHKKRTVQHRAERDAWIRFPNLGFTIPKIFVVLLVLLLVTTAGYVFMLGAVEGALQQSAVSVAFLLAMVIETGIVKSVMGPKTFDAAVKAIVTLGGIKEKVERVVGSAVSGVTGGWRRLTTSLWRVVRHAYKKILFALLVLSLGAIAGYLLGR